MRRKLLMYAVAALVAAGVGAVVLPSSASAHGTMMVPGSRTWMCYQDGRTATGEIRPVNPACAAAVAQSGVTSLYNWFAVLRSDGGGRMAGFIPDGQLCSGGTGGPYDFTGYNLPRADWPVTHLTSGATMEFDYNDWAKHPGTFSLYITKDSWSPTRALAWSDLESQPFSQVVNPQSVGGPGTNDGRYSWTANLPSGKSGRHLIYSVWSRSDSQETFYGCSDVTFDGGNGEVTGVGDSTIPPPSQEPSTPPSSSPPPNNPPSNPPSSSTPPPAGGTCTATYSTTSSWGGGFQGEVAVRATSALSNWMVHFNFQGSQTITQAWGGKYSAMGNAVMLEPADWNRQLPAGGTTTVGFIGSGTAPTVTGLECMPA